MDGKTAAKLLMILGGILILAACFMGMTRGFSILVAVLAGCGGIPGSLSSPAAAGSL